MNAGSGSFAISNVQAGTFPLQVNASSAAGSLSFSAAVDDQLITIAQPVTAGAVSIAFDQVAINAQVNAPTVSIDSRSPETIIFFANAADDVTTQSNMRLTATELAFLNTPLLSVGKSTNTGNVTFTNAVTRPAGSTLAVTTGTGNVTQAINANILVPNFAAQGNSVTLQEPGNNVGQIAGIATGAGQAFSFTNGGALEVGSVTRLPTVPVLNGITTSNGNVTLTVAGTTTISQNISAGAGAVSVTANGTNSIALTNNAVVSGGAVTLSAANASITDDGTNARVDTSATNGDITLTAGVIGSGSLTGQPFNVNPGTGTVNATGTNGNATLEQTSGDLATSQYVFNAPTTTGELRAVLGNVNVDADINFPGMTLILGTQAADKSVIIPPTGRTITAADLIIRSAVAGNGLRISGGVVQINSAFSTLNGVENQLTGNSMLIVNGIGTHAGDFTVAAGSTFRMTGGAHNFNAGSVLGGGGTVDFNGGTASINAGASVTNLGTFLVSGAGVTVNGGFTGVGTTTITAGTLDINGATAHTTNVFNMSAGAALGGTGPLTVANGGVLGGGTLVGTGLLTTNTTGAATTAVTGTVTLTGKPWNNGGTLNLTGQILLGGALGTTTTFTNVAGGIFNDFGDRWCADRVRDHDHRQELRQRRHLQQTPRRRRGADDRRSFHQQRHRDSRRPGRQSRVHERSDALRRQPPGRRRGQHRWRHVRVVRGHDGRDRCYYRERGHCAQRRRHQEP